VSGAVLAATVLLTVGVSPAFAEENAEPVAQQQESSVVQPAGTPAVPVPAANSAVGSEGATTTAPTSTSVVSTTEQAPGTEVSVIETSARATSTTATSATSTTAPSTTATSAESSTPTTSVGTTTGGSTSSTAPSTTGSTSGPSTTPSTSTTASSPVLAPPPAAAPKAAVAPASTPRGGAVTVTGSGFAPGEKVRATANPGSAAEFTATNKNGQRVTVRAGDSHPIARKDGRVLVVDGSALSVRIDGLTQGTGGTGGGTAANPNGFYLMTAVDQGAGKTASPAIGGVDLTGAGKSSVWITNFPYAGSESVVESYGKDGSVTVKYPIVSADDFTDCTKEAQGCVLYLRVDHRQGANRAFDVRLPLTFVPSDKDIPSAVVDLGTVKAGKDGKVSLDWTVGAEFPRGSAEVVLTGLGSGRTAATTLAVVAADGGGTGGGGTDGGGTGGGTPTGTTRPEQPGTAAAAIELSRARIGVGQELTVTGTGFTGAVTLTLHSDPVVLGTTTATAAGTFTSTVTVPAVTPGTHRVVAEDTAGHRAEYQVIVDPAELTASVDPAKARRGQQVTFTGTGFQPGERVSGSIVGSVPATSSVSAGNGNGQSMTVSAAGGSPIAKENGTLVLTAGTTVSVSVSGLTEGVDGTGGGTKANPNGFYLMVAAEVPGGLASPAIGGVDMAGGSGGSAWLTNHPYAGSENAVNSISGSGYASATMSVQSSDEFVNCAQAANGCVLYLRVDHRQTGNRDFDVKLPLRFAPADEVQALAGGTEVVSGLGDGVADAAGTVTFGWTVPADQPLGAQPVTLTGADSGRSAQTSLEVLTVDGESGGLAATGLDDPARPITLGLLLVGLGALMLFGARLRATAGPRRAH